MLLFFPLFFTLLATCVLVRSHGTPFLPRQMAYPVKDCNATCDIFDAAKSACLVNRCGCNAKYLQAQGDCYVCQTETPEDAAAVQFVLDSEIEECREEGVRVDFRLHLPPDAQAVVDKFYRQSAILRSQQTVFLALQIIGGHVGFVIILVFAMFSRQVHRDPIFLNFCITWISSSIVYSALLYRGTVGNSATNSLASALPQTCLLQAAFTNGAQVMTACSTTAFIIQLWISLRTTVRGDEREPEQIRRTTFLLVGSPYVFFLASAIPSVLIGRGLYATEGNTFQRAVPGNFYCSIIGADSFIRIIYGTTFLLLIVATVFDVLILLILYKHRQAVGHLQKQNTVSLSTCFRIILFSFYRVVVAIAFGMVLFKPPKPTEQIGSGDTLSLAPGVPIGIDMLQAAIPLVGVLVLGTNIISFRRSLNFCLRYCHTSPPRKVWLVAPGA